MAYGPHFVALVNILGLIGHAVSAAPGSVEGKGCNCVLINTLFMDTKI